MSQEKLLIQHNKNKGKLSFIGYISFLGNFRFNGMKFLNLIIN